MKTLAWILVFLTAAAWVAPASAQEGLPILSRIQLDVYGYVKLDASYDSQQTVAGNLMFFVLPEGPDGGKHEFNMTARESRLGLNLSVPGLDEYNVGAKFEIDFYSGVAENAANPRMRLAYLAIEKGNYSLLAGQDWETFIVAGPGYAVIPRIVNFSFLADAGALGLRRPQLRLTRDAQIGENTRFITKIAAARTIGGDLAGDGQNDGAAAGYPTGQGSLVLVTRAFGNRQTVLGLSGHFGSERVAAHTRDLPAGEPVYVPRKDYDTWSVIGNISQELSDTLRVQGGLWSGENLDTYFGGIGQGINPVQQTGIAAQGGWAQLVYQPTQKLNLNLGYGLDDPKSGDLNPGQREKNELIFASAFYQVASHVTWANEYSFLTTSYKDGDDAENHRVQSSMIFRF